MLELMFSGLVPVGECVGWLSVEDEGAWFGCVLLGDPDHLVVVGVGDVWVGVGVSDAVSVADVGWWVGDEESGE